MINSNLHNELVVLSFVIMVIILICFLYYNFGSSDIIYVKSDIDGELYAVRDLPDKQQACNMLSKIKQNIFKLSSELSVNMSSHTEYSKYIMLLNNRIKNCIIMESSENSVYTSYTVNKGEQLVFCLRSRASYNKLHDFNLLMYVVIHEISHVACPELNHTDLFKKIFAFFINEAIKMNLYQKIDFRNNNSEYCGIKITEHI
jgi:hypothetical protein